jgi:hypothetical protein
LVSLESRYFVTSLDPDEVSPQQLMRWIRGHWQVENSLHYVKDRFWDEDRHWVRRPGLAERLATLTNAALTALTVSPKFPKGHPIRARAEELCCHPLRALNLMTAHN